MKAMDDDSEGEYELSGKELESIHKQIAEQQRQRDGLIEEDLADDEEDENGEEEREKKLVAATQAADAAEAMFNSKMKKKKADVLNRTKIKAEKVHDAKRPLTMTELLTGPRSSIFEIRLGQAEVLKQAGNDNYKQGHTSDAVKLYERSLYQSEFESAKMSFEFTQEHREKVYLSREPVFLNLARCALLEERFRDALAMTAKIVRPEGADHGQPSLVTKAKALFLRGKAHLALSEYSQAEEELAAAQALEPNNKGILKFRHDIRLRVLADRNKEARTWGGKLKNNDIGNCTNKGGSWISASDSDNKIKDSIDTSCDLKSSSKTSAWWGFAVLCGIFVLAIALYAQKELFALHSK